MKSTKLALLPALALATIIPQPAAVLAQGTVFTYQGRLSSGGQPVNGIYDLTFALFDAATAGIQQGATLASTGTAVSNGLFTVALDFGGQFPGAARWLEISVRTNGGGGFTTLSPRDPLTAAPYAVTASNVSGVIPSGSLSGAYTGPVSMNNAANVFAGAFSGNGAGLTGLNAAALNGVSSSNLWQLGGNNVAPGQFLGSTNNQPVEVLVNGTRAWHVEPTANDVSHSNIVNLLSGAPVNAIAPGVYGAVIAGGGAVNYAGSAQPNSISNAADFAVISGGSYNLIYSNAVFGVIGGGQYNAVGAGSDYSTVGGGYANRISASNEGSTIAGGYNNGIQVGSTNSTVGGGVINFIYPNSLQSTIAGGAFNTIQSNNYGAVISGGVLNRIQPNGVNHVIAGGTQNLVQSNANYSVIGGGYKNTNSGTYATVPGGGLNLAGADYTLAAGYRAKATNAGAFVWADSQPSDFASTAPNQFAVRAQTGVVIQAGTNNTALELRSGGALKVTGAGVGTGTPVFIHQATASNTSGNATTIDHPLCNGDSNAILIVTPNWNPGGGVGVYNTNAVGVYYTGVKWAIFNQDNNPMPINSAYNVLVVKN
jgi:hypothetical protein